MRVRSTRIIVETVALGGESTPDSFVFLVKWRSVQLAEVPERFLTTIMLEEQVRLRPGQYRTKLAGEAPRLAISELKPRFVRCMTDSGLNPEGIIEGNWLRFYLHIPGSGTWAQVYEQPITRVRAEVVTHPTGVPLAAAPITPP